MSLAEELVEEALEKCYKIENPWEEAECIVGYWRAVESTDCAVLSELPSGRKLCAEKNPELFRRVLEEYKEGVRYYVEDFIRTCKRLRGKYTRWMCLETLIQVLKEYTDVFVKALGEEEHRNTVKQVKKLRDSWVAKALGEEEYKPS
ncbi:MAG: hypothetical protein QXZ31_03805 [Thermofilaceae archaeon]